MTVRLSVSLLLLAGTPLSAIDFAQDVYPVLRRACFECHGNDTQKAGLRLDEKAHALKGSEHGPVITPGAASQSELLRRIRLPRDDKEAMPRRGKALTPVEIAAIEQWIADGAAWPDTFEAAQHWSYTQPQRPALPTVAHTQWPKNEVDHFILARLEHEGLQPSPPAPTATLVRRLHLALTGLPPSPEEVTSLEKFGPTLPQAQVEALADRLLASEEFGVRWARPWLDLARYADSHGFQRDDLREIWAYRDWVVDALNADMPFDQFTIEQLAGDLLPDPSIEQIVATGFHRTTPTNVEAGTEPEESRINQVIDRVNTTGAVWMGSTLECCQCHDHKYDPFSHEDYYRMLAFFNNTAQEADRANPKVPGSIKFDGATVALEGQPNPERTKLQKKQSTLQKQMDRLLATADERFETWLNEMATALSEPIETHPLKLIEFVSTNGSTFEELDDGSILLTGPAPATDTYELVLQGRLADVTGFQLEALTDDRLPGTGPGRGDASRPNFVLNTFEVLQRTADANDDAGTPLTFVSATANFAQNNFDPIGAIDSDPKSGWAINPKFHEPHQARFGLKQTLNLTPRTELVVRLVQDYGGARTLGRVRVTALTGNLAIADLAPALAAALKKPTAKLTRSERAQLREHFDLSMPGLAPLKQEMASIEKAITALQAPVSEVMVELDQPRMSTVFKRGVYTDPGDPVTPATPAILPALEGAPANRLGLAQWIVSPQNPLTARVTVNRWWSELFGRGIVETLEDFGIKGAPPTHPELLDWMAVTLMEREWSMKATLRTLVTSATFQQNSSVTPALWERDPANTLLARGPRFRLSAEEIRDNALAIAGLLSTQKGGPSIRPPQPDGLWKKVGGQNYPYVVSPGEQQYRRGIYVVLKRGSPYPSFVNFDASARMACVVRRSRSNTPLQALTLLNDPVYVEAAQAFANRIIADEPQATAEERIDHACRLALSRAPTSTELRTLSDLYHSQLETTASSAQKSALKTDDLPPGVDPIEFNAWSIVATALLNLDETITLE